MAEKKLTPRQARFVDEYLIDLNATQAAIRAGYSERTAKEQGCRLLTNVHVAWAIEKRQAELAEETGITQRRVLDELALLGFSNMEDFTRATEEGEIYTDFSELTRDQMAAVQEVTCETYLDRSLADSENKDGKQVKRVKFKLADKKGALVEIGRHLGMFKDKVEHSGQIGLGSILEELDGRTRDRASDQDEAGEPPLAH